MSNNRSFLNTIVTLAMLGGTAGGIYYLVTMNRDGDILMNNDALSFYEKIDLNFTPENNDPELMIKKATIVNDTTNRFEIAKTGANDIRVVYTQKTSTTPYQPKKLDVKVEFNNGTFETRKISWIGHVLKLADVYDNDRFIGLYLDDYDYRKIPSLTSRIKDKFKLSTPVANIYITKVWDTDTEGDHYYSNQVAWPHIVQFKADGYVGFGVAAYFTAARWGTGWDEDTFWNYHDQFEYLYNLPKFIDKK
ncbi:MAG: hypothetical protein Ta2E_04860 [Mycoplasmoidaceae bacterium]|nr:MAG: hypothetical protein Ta2E_04860 [Mycoplasmoidaceae bacterium]